MGNNETQSVVDWTDKPSGRAVSERQSSSGFSALSLFSFKGESDSLSKYIVHFLATAACIQNVERKQENIKFT